MSLGSRLKAARLQKNLTQKQLGELVGVTTSAIGNYEKSVSSPNENTLIRLMNVLGVDANYLYTDYMESKSDSVFLSPEEERLITSFRALNGSGQDIVITTIQSLAGNPALRKDTSEKAI